MAKKPFEIQASIVIEATPAKVHEVMNDLARLDDWNPFMAMDKTVVSTLSEKTVGPGAVCDYAGKRIGKGRMELISSGPDLIRFKMTFFNKKTEYADAEYRIVPEFEGTKVTWVMAGERDLKMQIMGLIFNLDKMMTNNFMSGLKVLKAIVE